MSSTLRDIDENSIIDFIALTFKSCMWCVLGLIDVKHVCCRFVAGWLELYYHDDQEVQHDSELQSWIHEIHTEGFVGLTHTGKTF